MILHMTRNDFDRDIAPLRNKDPRELKQRSTSGCGFAFSIVLTFGVKTVSVFTLFYFPKR